MNHPGVNGFGVIEQGYVELSNVSLSQEMANLNRVCRSYKMTLQALQACGRNLRQADHSNDDGLRATPSAEKAIPASEPKR
jgi:flagellar basal body rod protein FlgG